MWFLVNRFIKKLVKQKDKHVKKLALLPLNASLSLTLSKFEQIISSTVFVFFVLKQSYESIILPNNSRNFLVDMRDIHLYFCTNPIES